MISGMCISLSILSLEIIYIFSFLSLSLLDTAHIDKFNQRLESNCRGGRVCLSLFPAYCTFTPRLAAKRCHLTTKPCRATSSGSGRRERDKRQLLGLFFGPCGLISSLVTLLCNFYSLVVRPKNIRHLSGTKAVTIVAT